MAANTPVQTGTDAGAVSHIEDEWDSIDWNTAHQNVRRLQMRIVQATKEGRWGKVKALQRLLTHSFYGKAEAPETSDGESRQENGRCRRRSLDYAQSKSESHTPITAARVSSQTASADIHSKEFG